MLNDVASRTRFIKYGIIKAVTYFQLGSRFATYGSGMEANNYSSLYENMDLTHYMELMLPSILF